MTKELLKELDQSSKSARFKRKIISHFIEKGPSTINELAKVLNLSIPTINKFVSDLIDRGAAKVYGKQETSGGRYPLLYGLDPEAGYFVGADVKFNMVNIGIVDFTGEIKETFYDIPFVLENSQEKMDELCRIILDTINNAGYSADNILNVNINLPGRINPETGFSYTFFNFQQELPLTALLSERLGLSVTIDNDTRGMAYGEYTHGCASVAKARNLLYLNLSWGLGLGIILDGKVYLGKSGFSGEFGHISAFDNQLLCHCGKKGCLETEVSGKAMQRILVERIKAGEISVLSQKVLAGEDLTFDEIIQATIGEDMLCLEVLTEMGNKLGKQVATLINLFNPECVVIGGALSLTGDFLTQSVQNVVRTHSLSLVNRDTKILAACLGERSGVIGACMLARTRRFC